MTPAVATTLRDVAPTREFHRDRHAVPVLIRVPALRTLATRRARRRRRLRREVRLGGIAILLGAPLFALGTWFPLGKAPNADRSVATSDFTTGRNPVGGGVEPPRVALLPEIEPVPTMEVTVARGESEVDDHWVAAWAEPSVNQREQTPEVGAERRQVQTPGYLLPALPDMGAGQGGKESPHAGS